MGRWRDAEGFLLQASTALALGCLLWVGACTGELVPSAMDTRTPGAPREGAAGGAPPSEAEAKAVPERVDPRDEAGARACAPSVAPAPLRRLSRAEYLASLEDLFPELELPTPQVLHDPAEHGFENRAANLNPVLQLLEQYAEAAEAVGAAVAENLARVVPCVPASADEEASCGRRIVAELGARIMRRPLSDTELADYTAFFEEERAATDFEGAVQLSVELLLQSPQFLYRLELGDPETAEPDRIQLTPHEIATRIAFLLTGSTPDRVLLDAADAGSLVDPEQRATQARRLLSDPRAASMLVEFHRQWLDFDRLAQEPKDAQRYPEYDDALMQAIREESDRFVTQVFWAGDGTIESFLTSTRSEANAPLARLYGVELEAAGWQAVELNPKERGGWLTRANFLASRAHKLEPSPPLRSVYVLEKFFCIPPPDPPADADLSEPRADAETEPKTNRELFEQRIAPASCQGCHSRLDTIGYGLENYDAIGRYRTLDSGFPVDARGELKNTDVDGAFTGGVELSQRLVQSDQVRTCVAHNWIQYALGREIAAEDECRVAKLNLALEEAGGDIRELLVELVRSPEFSYRPPLER